MKQYLGESPAAKKFGQDFFGKYQSMKAEMTPAAVAQWGSSGPKAASQALPKKEEEPEHKSAKQQKKDSKKKASVNR